MHVDASAAQNIPPPVVTQSVAPQAQFTELTTDPSLFSQAVYSEQLLLRNLVTGAPLKQKVFAPQKVFVSHWQAFELTVAPLVMEHVGNGLVWQALAASVHMSLTAQAVVPHWQP